MSEKEIMEKLNAAFQVALPRVDVNNLTQNTEFVGDLGLDSVDLVSLGIAIEEEFNISIPEDKFQELTTIRSAISAIEDLEVENCS